MTTLNKKLIDAVKPLPMDNDRKKDLLAKITEAEISHLWTLRFIRLLAVNHVILHSNNAISLSDTQSQQAFKKVRQLFNECEEAVGAGYSMEEDDAILLPFVEDLFEFNEVDLSAQFQYKKNT